MRIIGTVVLLLFAGILNFTNAEAIAEAIAEANAEASAESDEAMMETLCKTNGGPKAYDVFQAGFANFLNCTSSLDVDVQQFNSSDNGTIDAAFTEYCSEIGILGNCIEILAEAAKPCMESPVDELINLAVNSTAVVLQFPCINRKLMKDVITSTDQSCLTSKMEALENCIEEFFGDDDEDSNTTTSNPLAAENKSSESEDAAKTCREIRTFEECSVTALSGCTDQVFATALQSLFKYLNNLLPCENLPKLQNTEASPGSGDVNVL